MSYDEADKTPTKLARHLRGQDGVHSPATSVADDADVHFALTDDAYAKKVLPDSATVVDVTHQGGYTEVWARWE